MFTRTVAGAIGIVAVTLMILSGCSSGGSSGAANGSTSPPATEQLGAGTAVAASAPDHVMVVVFENEDAKNIVGAPDAPYLTSLAESGATFTNAHAETHPSQPNYLALFSGSTQGVTDDSCPQTFSGPNLAAQLQAAGLTFVGYSEDLPRAGFTGCDAGDYARRHNPWVNFDGLPDSVNQPYSALPADFADLPTVSFVVPNLCNDMHDCDVATGDRWARANLADYVTWAQQNNSLLVVTFDEDSGSSANDIATVLVGPMVNSGASDQRIDHYSLLRTLEDMYGLPPLGQAADAEPLNGIWMS
jgi:acid phosphatase